MDSLIEFQNMLNRTYDEDSEPIDKIKVKDLCMVFYENDWCRCEVIEMLQNKIGRMRITVHLIDSGRQIVTKKKYLCLLKGPHDSIAPFALKCQLSALDAIEKDLSVSERSALQKEFETVLKGTREVTIYVNVLILDVVNTYDVLLLTDFHTHMNTVHQAYLLHEVYGAFIWPKIRFDDEVCAEWTKNILQMAADSCMDYTKKMRIFLSYIVSPMEIYVKSKPFKKSMDKLRRMIDAYLEKVYGLDDIDSVENQMQRHNAEWSIGNDCLVRVQSWKTTTDMRLWFRGRIVAIDSEESTITVFLRDSGRKVDANLIDLMPISLELAAPRDAIQKCYLSISDDWLESSTDLLFNVIKEYKYFAISWKSNDENGFAVSLWATNTTPPDPDEIEIWDNIGLRIVSQSIRQSMDNFIKKSQHKYKRNRFQQRDTHRTDDSDTVGSSDTQNLLKYLCEDDLNPSQNDSPTADKANVEQAYPDDRLLHGGLLVHKWPRPLPFDRTNIIGTVTHITDKGIIYLQQESNIESLTQLDQAITKFIEANRGSNALNRPWRTDDTCFAEYDNNCYHRAVIKKINRERALALVILKK